jgi:hypothetical protein
MERGKEFFGRRRSETERRKILARTYYDFEVGAESRAGRVFVYTFWMCSTAFHG